MKKFLTMLVAAILLLVGALVTPAYAATQDCKAIAVTLPDRLDSGHFGNWAHLNMERVAQICVVNTTGTEADQVTHYTAHVNDVGTLTTIAGSALSPRQGLELKVQTGTVKGEYDQDFSHGGGAWADYQGNHPAESTKTTPWVATIYGAPIATQGIGFYTWTYKTCNEQWVDASTNNDGLDASAGDITGKACPTPTATPVATASSSHGAITSSGTPVATLPVTGSSGLLFLIIVGLLILVAGVGFVWFARKSRNANDQRYGGYTKL